MGIYTDNMVFSVVTLLAMLITTVVIILKSEWILRANTGWLMLGLYVVFVTVSVMLSVWEVQLF